MLKWASSLWKPPLRAGALLIRYKMWKTGCKTARHRAELPLWSSAASCPSPQLQQRLNTKPHFLPTGKTVNARILSHSHFAIRTTPRNMNPASIAWKALVLTCDPDLGWDPWEGEGAMIPGVLPPHGHGMLPGMLRPNIRGWINSQPLLFQPPIQAGKMPRIKSAQTLQLGDFISASVSSTEH